MSAQADTMAVSNFRGGLTLCCLPSQKGFSRTIKGMQVGFRGTAFTGSGFPIKGSVRAEVAEADSVDADVVGKRLPKMGSLHASSADASFDDTIVAGVTRNAGASFDAAVAVDPKAAIGSHDGVKALVTGSSKKFSDAGVVVPVFVEAYSSVFLGFEKNSSLRWFQSRSIFIQGVPILQTPVSLVSSPPELYVLLRRTQSQIDLRLAVVLFPRMRFPFTLCRSEEIRSSLA